MLVTRRRRGYARFIPRSHAYNVLQCVRAGDSYSNCVLRPVRRLPQRTVLRYLSYGLAT